MDTKSDNDIFDTSKAIDDPKSDQILGAMKDAGRATVERVQVDYFGFDQGHRYMLPDRISYIDYKALNEGERRAYMKATSKDLRIQSATRDTFLKMQAGEERYQLLLHAITGWNLIEGKTGLPRTYNEQKLKEFLNAANPQLIDDLYKEIMKTNAWLLGEMNLEDMIKERENLDELIEKKKEEEAGKATS